MESTVCRYGFDCFKEGCMFLHPEGRKVDKHKVQPHMGHHGAPMYYAPPQAFYPGVQQPPMYYPQPPYYAAPYMYPSMEPYGDVYNYQDYDNYDEYYENFQPTSSGEYVLDKEITAEMEEDFFDFQEGQQDPDTWIPERRNCTCCQGYVYKCSDKTCMSLGVCVCHYEHDENNGSSIPSTTAPTPTTSSIQVSSIPVDSQNTASNSSSEPKKYVPPHLREAVSEPDNSETYFDSKANCSCCKGYIYDCETPTCVMMGICGCQYCHSEPTVNELKLLLTHTKTVDDNYYQEILRISLTKENYPGVFKQVIDAIASFPDRHSVYANLISKLKQVNRNIFEDAAELTGLKRTLMSHLFDKLQPFFTESQSTEQNTEVYKAYFLSFEPLIEAKLITPVTLNKILSSIATTVNNIPLIVFALNTYKKYLTPETKASFTKQFKDKAEFKDTFASWS